MEAQAGLTETDAAFAKLYESIRKKQDKTSD